MILGTLTNDTPKRYLLDLQNDTGHYQTSNFDASSYMHISIYTCVYVYMYTHSIGLCRVTQGVDSGDLGSSGDVTCCYRISGLGLMHWTTCLHCCWWYEGFTKES